MSNISMFEQKIFNTLEKSKVFSGAFQIINTLKNKGFSGYIAGGAVRDAILGLEINEIDIATNARPPQIKAIFNKTVEVGIKYGIVIVIIDDIRYDVATFRGDLTYSDGRRPDGVFFSCELDDVRRRDFTINGLFYDPVDKILKDHVGGLKDIENKTIKAIGDPFKRMREDYLRIIRAIRFSSYLDFDIDARTLEAIKKYSFYLEKISKERIKDELIKIFSRKGASKGLKLLYTTGLLSVILPEVSAMVGIPQPKKFHPEGDVFEHVSLMYEIASFPMKTELAFGILMHDIGKPFTFKIRDRFRFNSHAEIGANIAIKIMRRLKFSNSIIKSVVSLTKNHLRFMNVKKMKISTLKRFFNIPDFNIHLELHRLDCLASHADLSTYYYCKEKLETFSREQITPPPLLRGQDLIRLGFKPGPIFSKILNHLETLQLEGKIKNRTDALDFIKDNYEKHINKR